MKKTIIAVAIILSSGIAALSFNKKAEIKNAEIKVNQTDFTAKQSNYGNFKADISNAD